MEKKIEKLEGSYDVPQLKQKLNEIIDHLNSQDQAGVFTEFTDKNISDDIPKGFVDIDGKLYKFEYTPEEWKEVNKDIWYMVGGKKYVNINGEEYIRTSDLEQLLDEREREVLNSMREWVVEYHKDNWDIRDFDAEIAIGKIIDRELDKLLNKKK